MLSRSGSNGAGHLPTESIVLRQPQMGAGEERRTPVKEKGDSLTVRSQWLPQGGFAISE